MGDDRMTRRGFVRSSALLTTGAAVGVGGPAAAAGLPTTEGKAVADAAAQDRVPAFPGAEGCGRYATGGRGKEVYEVTTLDSSGPGSLRDAVSKGNRTVVFRVSGTINIVDNGLDVLGDNITILGQTAPGDGICVLGNEFSIKGSNVILRYLRVRGGDMVGTPIDVFKAEGVENLMIDHCSVSWGVDECFSVYGVRNVTVQWCLIAEGLTMSEHEKGRHGYGGLWGGENVTYHHNLLVHQGGRNPRFSFVEDVPLRVDHRNNVIYDYGYTSCYGGEWADGVNMVANYYRPGPATLESIAPVIVAPGRIGRWHVQGNVIEGHSDVTENNELGIDYPVGGITRLSEPAEIAIPYESQPARDAYRKVLTEAGAVLPRRDATDARLIADVQNRTGRQINSQDEVGGPPPLRSADPPKDSDHDGIPDAWEKQHGLDPKDPADGVSIGPDGYSNLERYANSIDRRGAPNPTVRITTPELDEVFTNSSATKQITIEAEAQAADGEQITSVEFFAGAESIGIAENAPYRVTWKGVSSGTYYLTALATDGTGSSTFAGTVPIHVNRTSSLGAWFSRDIGKVPIAGAASLQDGTLTVKGSGKIRGHDDTFRFVYQQIDAGTDNIIELTARIDSLSRPYEGVTGGLMIRESLEPDSQYFFGGLTWHEDGLVIRVNRIARDGDEPSIGDYPYEEVLEEKPYWLRLRKRGREFSIHLSEDSLQWERAGYERLDMGSKLYIGMAVDGNKEANEIAHYTVARFSQLSLAR